MEVMQKRTVPEVRETDLAASDYFAIVESGFAAVTEPFVKEYFLGRHDVNAVGPNGSFGKYVLKKIPERIDAIAFNAAIARWLKNLRSHDGQAALRFPEPWLVVEVMPIINYLFDRQKSTESGRLSVTNYNIFPVRFDDDAVVNVIVCKDDFNPGMWKLTVQSIRPPNLLYVNDQTVFRV